MNNDDVLDDRVQYDRSAKTTIENVLALRILLQGYVIGSMLASGEEQRSGEVWDSLKGTLVPKVNYLLDLRTIGIESEDLYRQIVRIDRQVGDDTNMREFFDELKEGRYAVPLELAKYVDRRLGDVVRR